MDFEDLPSQAESPSVNGGPTRADNIAQFPDLIKSIEKMEFQQKHLNKALNRICRKNE
jgi:hypothetical protein